MARLLIIGSTGFLGSALLGLIPKNHETLTLDRNKNPKSANAFDYKGLGNIKDVDVVFLLASHIPYGKMDEKSQELQRTNIDLVAKLSEHFCNSRIVFSSSVSVYGETADICNESSIGSKVNAYGKSKLQGESLIQKQKNHIILRFSSIYGPGMKAKSFLPIVLQQAKEKKRLNLIGNSDRAQDYIYLQDAAEFLFQAGISQNQGVYNACFGKSFSNEEIAQIIKKLLPETEINYQRGKQLLSHYYSMQKWQKDFTFKAKIDPEEGIKRMLAT